MQIFIRIIKKKWELYKVKQPKQLLNVHQMDFLVCRSQQHKNMKIFLCLKIFTEKREIMKAQDLKLNKSKINREEGKEAQMLEKKIAKLLSQVQQQCELNHHKHWQANKINTLNNKMMPFTIKRQTTKQILVNTRNRHLIQSSQQSREQRSRSCKFTQ